MLRKSNLILTFAKGPIFDDPNFWSFISSLERVPDTDYAVLSDDISEENHIRLEDLEIDVVATPPVKHLFRDRHLQYWDYLNDHGHKYQHALVCDCRDVLFQSSPFDWIPEWKSRFDRVGGNKSYLDHFVILTAEGFRTATSGFACVDNFEFQSDIPTDHLRELKNKWVINGGVMLGTPQALMNFHFLIWTMMLKSRGRCTDQAAINYLMSWLDEDSTYNVSFPQHDSLCLTGEGVKENAVTPILEGGLLKNPLGQPYCILHQWDRLDDSLRQALLAHLS